MILPLAHRSSQSTQELITLHLFFINASLADAGVYNELNTTARLSKVPKQTSKNYIIILKPEIHITYIYSKTDYDVKPPRLLPIYQC